MSLPVAIQSAIFYYLACTPCNEMKAFRKAKKKAKEDREVKRRIEMEQPGLYRHPDPFNINPYWAEEMAMGPHLPKKSGSKNPSQRGLASAGRTSTAASFGCGSTAAESGPVSPTISTDTTRKLSGDGWNRTLYQREDEELWGHNLTGMGHKIMDNIVKAGNTAGRYVEEKLGRDKQPITDEDRQNFYQTPRNPPVNDYHPPIVGNKPSRPDALKWMLQPPPPAKIMEGRVPVTRTQSTSTVGSRRTLASEEPPLDRLVREKALQKKLRQGEMPRQDETPSESELINSLIGTRSRKSTASRGGISNRSRSLSLESEVSSDGELVERRRRARARRIAATPEESSSSDEDDSIPHRTWDSLGHASPPRRPRLETIGSSRSNAREALKARPNGTKPDAAPKDNSDITPKASANPIVALKADENTPTNMTQTASS
ncbi:hypothetical protein CSOJ01_04509 [Colletotrichum sojae]|uniref:Signal peptide-containing protein n=1 Tax=Colletotrichum sojae TaxID=2175907 RepID=A0A8H6JIF8_9PEZI|nr:hypothetical protein CSOJ01_04509 [Colletotrichum sojae]